MTKEQVIFIRNKYAGKPIIITMGGTATFFADNYPGRLFPIWDDENELVTSIETHRENSGMSSKDFPYVAQICPYSDIESIRVLSDMTDVIDLFKDNENKLDKGRYEYNMDIISNVAHNSRPDVKPYYK